ncbi:MAG TPA: RidA family protein [Chloroflexota bacterium]|jgi:enamine deaminase RidA (YjgF/YER057c/UK114 family)|nr:RidA family protein [Chloroflexota bacterium]
MSRVEERLAAKGLKLPDPPRPIANYVEAVRSGNLLFLAGHGPSTADGKLMTGKVGVELDIEGGYRAAQVTALALLATLKHELGDLDRVKRIVKLLGMVNCQPDFEHHPEVINGCSDLLVEAFGPEVGKHARSAVGMGSLPRNIPVEIEMVVEVA